MTGNPELAAIHAGIEKINHRLDSLEKRGHYDNRISTSIVPHPSTEKFDIAEAIVDSLFVRNAKEKACTFEPSKPCDHCSMCNSRGF